MQEVFDAIERHDLPRLKILLAKGADPDQVEADIILKRRPLHAAVVAVSEGGSMQLVEALLASGADIDKTSLGIVGGSPLLCALFEGEFDLAMYLLDAGADPNVRGAENTTPLRWAVKNRKHEIAARLLKSGDALTIDDYDCSERSNALGMAVYRLDVEMVRLLLEAGASPTAIDLDYRTATENLPPHTVENDEAWNSIRSLLAVTNRDKPP